MRLLIAGWQGQIARAFVEIAPARKEVSACALGRPALDICEVRTIERALSENRPDIIINTAGYTAVDEAENDPLRALAMNRDGARLLAMAAAERRVPIIHLSTVNVFDGAKTSPYVEDDQTAPANHYGVSKLQGEAAVRDVNPRHVILRTSWLFSPFGSNFVKTILSNARAGNPIRVVTDQIGSPTYAPDLASAIIDVAVRAHQAQIDGDDRLWGTYHIANGGEAVSWHDFAQEICKAANAPSALAALAPITTADYPTRAPRLRNAALDTSRFSETWGIDLRDWRQALDVCLARLSKPS
ncbi:MAG: dTDP-4-dehydrorhamnose reductase [Hyphomicrobiaceae bacterium]|nr:dTDP-4-dehydrorhamnose reductase [Hyphomicrobiaceae bacterium]